MGHRWITLIMANNSPDVCVKDDANVGKVLAERQRYFDQILANRENISVEEAATRRVVICDTFSVPVIDDKENSFML